MLWRAPLTFFICLSCSPVAAPVPPHPPFYASILCVFMWQNEQDLFQHAYLDHLTGLVLKAGFEDCAAPNCKWFYETCCFADRCATTRLVKRSGDCHSSTYHLGEEGQGEVHILVHVCIHIYSICLGQHCMHVKGEGRFALVVKGKKVSHCLCQYRLIYGLVKEISHLSPLISFLHVIFLSISQWNSDIPQILLPEKQRRETKEWEKRFFSMVIHNHVG